MQCMIIEFFFFGLISINHSRANLKWIHRDWLKNIFNFNENDEDKKLKVFKQTINNIQKIVTDMFLMIDKNYVFV
jgi:hypothetical protein